MEPAAPDSTAKSIPQRMGEQARGAIDQAEVEANTALTDLEDKAVGALDTVQEKMDEFMGKVDAGRNTVVDGIDKAIEAIEKPLKELIPTLKAKAEEAIQEAFTVVEDIPAQVEARVKEMKDPFVEQIQAQAQALADMAAEQLGALEEQLETVKARITTAASTQLDGVIERVGGLADVLIERLGDGIVILEQKFAKVYEGKPGYDEIKGELKTALDDLKTALAEIMRTSIDSAKVTIVGIKDKAIVAIDATFDQLFETLKALPEQINESVQNIVEQIDATFDAALADAKAAAERLVESLRLKLETAVASVNEAVEGIINDGFALIHEARTLLLRAIDSLIGTVRTFSDNTMTKIRDAIDDMVRTSREAIELGLTKVREGIDLACDDMADDMAQQVANTREKMIREAERQARQLQVAGKEAAAEARKEFVVGGYVENEGMVTGIRLRGERAVEAMEAKMQAAVEEVRLQFEGQIEKYVPKFETQGKVLIGVSKASTLKIVKIVATLGPSIATDLVNKGTAFVEEFQDIGAKVDSLINEKGQAYIANCETRVLGTVDVLKTQAISFASEAQNTIQTLVGGMRTRFEGMVDGVSVEVKSLVEGIVALITDAAQDTEARFTMLYAESRDAVQLTIDETEEAIAAFLAEAERIFDAALEAGTRIARDLLDELKKAALEALKSKLDGVLEALSTRYAPKLQKGIEHLEETTTKLFARQGDAERAAKAARKAMQQIGAKRAALEFEKNSIEFEMSLTESEAVLAGLAAKLNVTTVKMAAIRGEAEVIYTDLLAAWDVAMDGFEAIWDGATQCLEALYADALTEGRATVSSVKQRLIDEGIAIAGDHDLTIDEANARFEAMQVDVLATLATHGETMRASLVDDHSIQLHQARDAMAAAAGVLEHHLQRAVRQLGPVSDPRMLLQRIKDVVLPELETFVATLLEELLACYGDRVRETISPKFEEALQLVTDALQGAPAAARAWAIIRDEHLPALRTRAETVLSQVDDQIQSRLAGVDAAIESSSKTIGGSVSNRLQAQATGHMGTVRARVEAGTTQAKDSAVALLDSGAKVLAMKADSDVNPTSQLAHAAIDLKGGLRADMSTAAAAGSQFGVATDGAGKGLGETGQSAAAQADEARKSVAADAGEMAEAGNMRGVMAEAGESLKEAQETAVTAVEDAGGEAKAGMAESRAETGSGAADDDGDDGDDGDAAGFADKAGGAEPADAARDDGRDEARMPGDGNRKAAKPDASSGLGAELPDPGTA